MKLFVILSRFPYPLEKGDKLRAYHQIKILSQTNDIYLFALSEHKITSEEFKQLSPFCKEIHYVRLTLASKIFGVVKFLIKGLPIQCGYFYKKSAYHKVHELVQRIQPDHIYCQLVRVAEYVKTIPITKTLDYQDVFSKGMYRRYKKAPFYLRPFFKLEYLRMSKYERSIFSFFDHRTIITVVDRDLIPHTENEKIDVIANGVDFEQFAYHGEEKEFDLIFAGNMSYQPNVDAAEYLVKQLFPLLLQEFPNMKLVLCGAKPSPKVLAFKRKNIIVTGWVDSMAAYYAKSKIFIAPMRLGTGLQNKLLEAMAMELPCITSSLAGKPLEGIEAGKDILICNTDIGYVDAVRLLLNNPDIMKEISQNGHSFVMNNYNWETITHKLDLLINQEKQNHTEQ